MSSNSEFCPICAQGTLFPEERRNTVEYKEQQSDLPLHLSICDSCGSEITSPVQAKTNKRSMMAFRKEVDGLLPGSYVREYRMRRGLTVQDAGNILGGGPVAFSKYESDDVCQSQAMDNLLRVVNAVPGAYEYLVELKASDRSLELDENQWKKISRKINAPFAEKTISRLIEEYPVSAADAANQPHYREAS